MSMRCWFVLPAVVIAGYGMAGRAIASRPTTLATVALQCANENDNGKVTIRWGQKTYDQNGYVFSGNNGSPYFTAYCRRTMDPAVSKTITLTARDSQFEVQTEGGTTTAYTIVVTVASDQGAPNTVTLLHPSAGDVVVMSNAFDIKRSSGPNVYGEQNFRITLPPGTPANIKMTGQAWGDKTGAQMAVRWGHPDFNDHSDIPTWTVKRGPSVDHLPFGEGSARSEFEIQTKSGKGTGYQLAVWIDTGSGFTMQPSFLVNHNLDDAPSVNRDILASPEVAFTLSGGNQYGERTVSVRAPFLPAPSTSPNAAQTGGLTFDAHFGAQSYPGVAVRETLAAQGNWTPGSSTSAAGTTGFTLPFQQLNGPPGTTDYHFNGAQDGLRPGNWTIGFGIIDAGGHFSARLSCPAKIVAGDPAAFKVDLPMSRCP